MVKEEQNMDNWKEIVENELKLKGFSRKTMGAYTYYIGRFINSQLGPKEFLVDMINNGKSKQTVRVAGFAIKFYLNLKSKQDETINKLVQSIPNIKTDKMLPVILSKQEVEQMMLACTNINHKVIIMMLYSAGMRASEVASLQWEDVDFQRNILHIKRGKGAKDRVVMLSPKLKKQLSSLSSQKQGIVFKTNRNGKYTLRAVEMIIKNAAQKAGIKKRITPHSLRHSFATHLLERGTDIRYIKDLLGHARVETTMIYTKVSNRDISRIKSPLDDL